MQYTKNIVGDLPTLHLYLTERWLLKVRQLERKFDVGKKNTAKGTAS